MARKGVSLKARVQELERRLAQSVPKRDIEALQTRIKELEAKLAESVPRADLEAAKARIKELEAKLAAPPTEKPPTT